MDDATTICDRVCKNQPFERKLHQVIFLLISSALNVVFLFHRKPITFYSSDRDLILLVSIIGKL